MPPSLRRILLGVVAVLTAALTTYGVTAEPGKPPPVPPTPPTPTPTATATAAPGPGSTDEVGGPGCVAPPGQTKLLDQDTSDSQRPWRRGGNPKMPIVIAAAKVAPDSDWAADLNYAAAQWNRSPCLDMRVVFGPCPAGANCVTFAVGGRDDGNFDAIERGGYTVGGSVTVNPKLSAGERRNVVVHEAGHVAGLAHRKTKRVLMNGDTYSDVFNPNATDYANLAYSYTVMQK